MNEQFLIQKYKKKIRSKQLTIENADSLSLSFIQNLEVNDLTLNNCPNINLSTIPNKIKKLLLYKCDLNGVEGLGDKSELAELTVIWNPRLKQIESIRDLIQIQRLVLYRNDIVDIKPLTKLVNITELVLNNNAIEDITALSRLIEIQTLKLFSNKISDIWSLKKMKKLKYLDLYDNQIIEIEPIREIIRDLTFLSLDNNYISESSISLITDEKQEGLEFSANEQKIPTLHIILLSFKQQVIHKHSAQINNLGNHKHRFHNCKTKETVKQILNQQIYNYIRFIDAVKNILLNNDLVLVNAFVQ
ncbi:leucine-rich_repeat domain-containing protein [Hexamita inflata]|uniref:Leucine-rich_repeat domain-containing protein n=1 Tax=Hexamita inflata TaxID=28002 RepID=A0ABP1K437_9EUKA